MILLSSCFLNYFLVVPMSWSDPYSSPDVLKTFPITWGETSKKNSLWHLVDSG